MSRLQQDLRSLETALGGSAEALYLMVNKSSQSPGTSICAPPMLPVIASCKALDSCTRERRVRALETPLFIEMRFISALRLANGKGLLRAVRFVKNQL